MEAILLGVSILVAVLAVIAFRLFAMRRIVQKRLPIDISDIHRTVADKVSLDTVKLVLLELGSAYSVDPRLVRPEDSLKRFFDLDSWDLGVGTEKLSQWLKSIGIEKIDAQPETVLDLLILVESRHKPSQSSSA